MENISMNKYFDNLIKEYGTIEPLYVWSKVKSLDELFYCNKEFIKDNLNESFYYYGSLAIDSKPLINDLLKLHDRGVFTCGGQGSLFSYDNWIDDEWIDHEGNKCGKWYASIEQKPYLDCYLKKEYMNDLIKYFESINTKNPEDKINYIIRGKNIKKTNIVGVKYNVTRSKTFKEISEKDNAQWNNYTNFWTNYDFEECDLMLLIKKEYEDIYKIIHNDYISLDLTVINYGSNISIEKVLLDFFN